MNSSKVSKYLSLGDFLQSFCFKTAHGLIFIPPLPSSNMYVPSAVFLGAGGLETERGGCPIELLPSLSLPKLDVTLKWEVSKV